MPQLDLNTRANLPRLLPDWTLEPQRDALQRQLRFADFAQAFGFMAQMALISEQMNHHPEWSNVYNRLDIILTTHDVSGLSELDIRWAQKADALYRALAQTNPS